MLNDVQRRGASWRLVFDGELEADDNFIRVRLCSYDSLGDLVGSI